MEHESSAARYRRWARNILEHASADERASFGAWARRLLDIRDSREFPPVKVQLALQASIDPAFSARSLQLLGRELKRIGWDERDTYERLGISVAGTMAMLTSVGAVAFAAFGSAFSVPMWVVFGSGDAFARILAEESAGTPDAPDAVRATPGAPQPAPARDDPEAASAPLVLINIGRAYDAGMGDAALYEATRGAWRIGADKRGHLRYALAVADGAVREVYRIEAWHPAGSTPYATRDPAALAQAGRWEFTGQVASASAREALLGLAVETLFKAGNANPIRYMNL